MKNLFLMASIIGMMGLAGCTATKSVVKEFDAEGNLVKETVTNESMVKEITSSTKDKTVIVWENGWMAYLSVSTATTDDPTPTAKIFAGKAAKGLISALNGQTDWEGIARAISATKENLSVTTSGITGASAPQGADAK